MVKECKSLQDGGREGIARALSQLCTYPFESSKACIQVFGEAQKKPSIVHFYKGALQSSLTSGFVFGSYFTIYNSLHPNPLASSIASFITSFVKIPISNCMRVLQINQQHKNFIESGQKIVRRKGIQGLYSGYSVSLLEDIVETNIRNYVYEQSKFIVHLPNPNPKWGMVAGALAGGLGAAVTTPFDTIRANLAYHATQHGHTDIFKMTKALVVSNEGPKVLFRGMHLRATSNALRYAVFYLIMEALYMI